MRKWKSDATDDPALVPGLLRGARNTLVIPKGRGIVIDFDDERAVPELEDGRPAADPQDRLADPRPRPRLRVGPRGHRHGVVPGRVHMGRDPPPQSADRQSEHGPGAVVVAIRRHLHAAGRRADHRHAARLGHRVPDRVEREAGRRQGGRSWPRGRGLDDRSGRHLWLVGRARWLRGNGLSGERLFDELVRLDRDRCRPPIAEDSREGIDEIKRIAGWTKDNIGDDSPPIRIVNGSAGGGVDGAVLLAMDLPPLRWIVPGLLPEGTTLLAAPPKVGKSCLVYQAAIEVSLGGELFGERVASGSALYLALEDGMRRGQDRLRTALAGRTLPAGASRCAGRHPASARAWKSCWPAGSTSTPMLRRRRRHARAGATPREGTGERL